MQSRYNPFEAEKKWYSVWLEKDLFRPRSRRGRPFVIVMPPPNITGMLTIGHVLNMSLQDVLIRWNMIRGRECLWLPGKDHAGIATQNAVERQLHAEGLSRYDLGRPKFVERVWQWKEKMDQKITEQIKDLGCACDWSRERFTMDENLSLAVRTAFVSLFKEGLIYRGEYVINSCPRCLTTLADEEVEREDIQGKLYYINYPLEGGGQISVATTRPETMLGDVAVAVNPTDDRYSGLVGKTAILPILKRGIPIIADDFVDPDFGTGAVKVTPAHDADDFELGRRHGLKPIVIMNQQGIMNDNAGPYAKLDRFEARSRIIEELKIQGLLQKVEQYGYSLGKCYRCSTIVEPFLSKQYFVRMEPLAKPAIEVVRNGRIKFHPERWAKVYFNWMESIRDWCISRQLWWGHRIPVWYCDNCDLMISEMTDPSECPKCGGPVHQEEDVLDTWFSSWLWPISTLGWPKETEDLERYYPTSVLVTAPDIIFFWVARMIMAGLHFKGEIPFYHVYLHGLIRDEYGRKMSKSLGNSPDPSDLISKYGADALRFTMVSLTPKGSDILFSEKYIEMGRNFANKVWNAARLLSAVVSDRRGQLPTREGLELCDRWILSRVSEVTRRTEDLIESFELNQAGKAVYDFIWHEFCDWYLELAKERFYSDEQAVKATAAEVACRVFAQALKLLHPMMPFLTEEVWNVLALGRGSILESKPVSEVDFQFDAEAESRLHLVQAIVEAVRNIRGEMNVHPSVEVDVFLTSSENIRTGIAEGESYIKRMGKIKNIYSGKPGTDHGPVATSVVDGIEIGVPLGDIIDVDVERNRLEKELKRVESLLAKAQGRLSDPLFREKAPPEIVEKEEAKSRNLAETASKLRRSLSVLGGN